MVSFAIGAWVGFAIFCCFAAPTRFTFAWVAIMTALALVELRNR